MPSPAGTEPRPPEDGSTRSREAASSTAALFGQTVARGDHDARTVDHPRSSARRAAIQGARRGSTSTSSRAADGRPGAWGELTTTLGLRHGGPHPVRLRWETLGDPSLATVVVLGGISADRHVARSLAFPEPGWWDAQVGTGRAVDPARHHVVAIDWVGADGSIDVPIDTSDQADAVITTLEHLGISAVAAFVGCSYGALVGLQLAVRHRRRLGHLIAISGTSRPHPYAAAYRAIQREVVSLALAAGRGPDGLALARQLGMLSYRTPTEFGQRFHAPTELVGDRARCAPQPYLEARGAAYAARWTPTAFLRLSESIDLHAIDPGQVRVSCTLAAVSGDWLVPPDDVDRLGLGIRAPVTVHRIDSIYGHDAFLKETAQVAEILRHGLAAAAGVVA